MSIGSENILSLHNTAEIELPFLDEFSEKLNLWPYFVEFKGFQFLGYVMQRGLRFLCGWEPIGEVPAILWERGFPR